MFAESLTLLTFSNRHETMTANVLEQDAAAAVLLGMSDEHRGCNDTI
jgi:hypothetical protein